MKGENAIAHSAGAAVVREFCRPFCAKPRDDRLRAFGLEFTRAKITHGFASVSGSFLPPRLNPPLARDLKHHVLIFPGQFAEDGQGLVESRGSHFEKLKT
jgi:hypothetical protein